MNDLFLFFDVNIKNQCFDINYNKVPVKFRA